MPAEILSRPAPRRVVGDGVSSLYSLDLKIPLAVSRLMLTRGSLRTCGDALQDPAWSRYRRSACRLTVRWPAPRVCSISPVLISPGARGASNISVGGGWG